MYQARRPCTRLITCNFVSIGTGVLSIRELEHVAHRFVEVSDVAQLFASLAGKLERIGRNDVRLPVRLEPVRRALPSDPAWLVSCRPGIPRVGPRGSQRYGGNYAGVDQGVDKHDVLKRFCGSGPGRSACSRR